EVGPGRPTLRRSLTLGTVPIDVPHNRLFAIDDEFTQGTQLTDFPPEELDDFPGVVYRSAVHNHRSPECTKIVRHYRRMKLRLDYGINGLFAVFPDVPQAV